MSNTTVAYYKLKPSPTIRKSGSLASNSHTGRAASTASARSIVARLLFTALILLLTATAQAQRGAAETHIVRPGETLGLIAQSYGVDVGDLASTNGISNAHHILSWQELTIPAGASPRAAAAATGATHIVRRGETLGSIAEAYGLPLIELRRANNIWTWFIYAGQELVIPGDGAINVEADAPAKQPLAIQDPAPDETSASAESSRATHRVRSGETLGSIAELYGLTVYDLQAANNIWTWTIYVGQELEIPGDGIPLVKLESTRDASPAPEETEATIEPSGITHTVQFGETLGTIAAAYGVSLSDLQSLNQIWTWIIYVGQELEIPAGGTLPEAPDTPSEPAPADQSSAAPSTPVQNTAPASTPATHTVQRGETLFSIAKTYGVDLDALIRANGILDATKIHSGLVLRVRDLESYNSPQPITASVSNTATSPSAAPAPQSAIEREKYTVQPGEFLSQIGARLGMSWLAIAKVNGLSNPDSLKVGTVLLIPTAEEAAKYGPVLPTYEDPGARVGVGREFVVVLSTQMAYAYEDGLLKRSARISSGLPDTPTVKGDFRIRLKVRSQRMTGEDYDLENVEWVMYFYAGYAFHGTWWHNNFGTPMSRGCVNMTNTDAKWFYEFGSIGTPVHVRD